MQGHQQQLLSRTGLKKFGESEGNGHPTNTFTTSLDRVNMDSAEVQIPDPPQRPEHFSVRRVQPLSMHDRSKMPYPRVDDIINREVLLRKLQNISYLNRRGRQHHHIQSHLDELDNITADPQVTDQDTATEWERLMTLKELVEAYDEEDIRQSNNRQGVNAISNMAKPTSALHFGDTTSSGQPIHGATSFQDNRASFPFPTPSTSLNPAAPIYTPMQRPLPPIYTQATQIKARQQQKSTFFTRPTLPTIRPALQATARNQRIIPQRAKAPTAMPPPQTPTARLLRPFATPMGTSIHFKAGGTAISNHSTAAKSPFFNSRAKEANGAPQVGRNRSLNTSTSFRGLRRGMIQGSPWTGLSHDSRFSSDLGIEGRRRVRR